MPNWCSNQMVVYGDKQEVEDFYKKLQNAYRRAKETKNWDLYEVYAEFGEENILSNDSNGYIRGSIIDINDIKFDKGDFYLCIVYESAWSSMMDGFDYLLNKYYKTLNQETLAEEMGMEIFINTDRKGRFFKEKYCLDIVDYDIHFCENEQEVVDTLNKYVDNHHFSTIKDCVNYLLLNHNEIKVGGETTNCYLHEYSYC